nr:membrane-spanning 4-domains subfamily A member 12-like [Dasypus novemcinctus]
MSMAQQPATLINPINQAQGSQPPFINATGIIINCQQGQGYIQMRNSVLGTINTDFKEEAKILPGKGISAMLMIFSLLKFCITCTTAHFTNQANIRTNRVTDLF